MTFNPAKQIAMIGGTMKPLLRAANSCSIGSEGLKYLKVQIAPEMARIVKMKNGLKIQEISAAAKLPKAVPLRTFR